MRDPDDVAPAVGDDPLSLLLRDADARRGAAYRRKIEGAGTAAATADEGPTPDEVAAALDLLIKRVEDAEPADRALVAPGAWQAGLLAVARRMNCTPEIVLAHLSGHGGTAWALLELILESGLAAQGRSDWLEAVAGDGRNGRPMTPEEAGVGVSYTEAAATEPIVPASESRRGGGGHWWQR